MAAPWTSMWPWWNSLSPPPSPTPSRLCVCLLPGIASSKIWNATSLDGVLRGKMVSLFLIKVTYSSSLWYRFHPAHFGEDPGSIDLNVWVMLKLSSKLECAPRNQTFSICMEKGIRFTLVVGHFVIDVKTNQTWNYMCQRWPTSVLNSHCPAEFSSNLDKSWLGGWFRFN